MIFFMSFVIANIALNVGSPLPTSNMPVHINNTMTELSLEEVIKQQNMLFSSDKLIKMDLNHQYKDQLDDDLIEDNHYNLENKQNSLILANSNMEYDYTNVYSDLIISEDDADYDEARDPESYAFHFRQFINEGI